MEEEEIKNTSWRAEKGSRAQMEELVLRRRRSLLPLKSGGKNRMGICTDKCVGRQQNLRDLFHGWEPQFSLGRDRSKEGDWELGGGARASGHGSQHLLGDLDVNAARPVTHTHRNWWGRASLTLCSLLHQPASEPDLRELLWVANDTSTNINDKCSKLDLKSARVFPQLQSSVWQDPVYSSTLSGITLTSPTCYSHTELQ